MEFLTNMGALNLLKLNGIKMSRYGLTQAGEKHDFKIVMDNGSLLYKKEGVEKFIKWKLTPAPKGMVSISKCAKTLGINVSEVYGAISSGRIQKVEVDRPEPKLFASPALL